MLLMRDRCKLPTGTPKWVQRLAAGFRNTDGLETLEFAFASILVIVFILGIMEMCILLFVYSSAAEAAREASRWASVRGTNSSITTNGVTSCANPNITSCPAGISDIQNFAKRVPGITGSNATVSVSWCDSDGVTHCITDPSNAKPGNIVKVQVSYTFASVPFISKTALTVSSTAETVIWQ
jgi:Flp pilus assembly protein TadG